MEYPPELYEGIISINEQLCMQQKEAVSIKNGNDIVNVMLDGVQFTIMHQNTYRTIWTCLNQQLFSNAVNGLSNIGMQPILFLP